MNKYTEFLRTFLVNVFKMTDTEVSDLIKTEETFEPTAALTALTEKDKGRISKISGKFQEGVNKGYADALTEIDNALLKKYGITPDPDHPLKTVDLVDHIITAKAGEGVTGEVSKLTADDIRKLPAFQHIQRDFTKQLTATKTEAENKVKEIETTYKKKEVKGTIGKSVLDILGGLNPVLPKNPTAAEKQKSSYLNEVLDAYDWEDQDGNFVPIGKDGKVALDAHGNALTLEGLAKAKDGEWFEFAQNNGGGNAGNGRPGQEGGGTGGKSYPAGIQRPKNVDQLSVILNDTKIPLSDREIVSQEYEKEFGAN